MDSDWIEWYGWLYDFAWIEVPWRNVRGWKVKTQMMDSYGLSDIVNLLLIGWIEVKWSPWINMKGRKVHWWLCEFAWIKVPPGEMWKDGRWKSIWIQMGWYWYIDIAVNWMERHCYHPGERGVHNILQLCSSSKPHQERRAPVPRLDQPDRLPQLLHHLLSHLLPQLSDHLLPDADNIWGLLETLWSPVCREEWQLSRNMEPV